MIKLRGLFSADEFEGRAANMRDLMFSPALRADVDAIVAEAGGME